jgi:hypothetical protein
MSCSPLWARKKRNLHPNHRRPRHSLCAELGCGCGANLRSPASLSGTSTTSQTILFRCLTCLRHPLLWGSLPDAHGQTRDLFGGSSQCRSSSLPETPGSQIPMLYAQNAILGKEHPAFRLLLQPQAISQTTVSEILLSPH